MILLILAAAAFVVGIIGKIKCNWFVDWPNIVLFFSIPPLIVLIVIALVQNVNVEGHLQEVQAKRETLVYRLEHQTFYNDNNFGANELFDDISKFNGWVYKNREGRKIPVINIYFFPCADMVDPIDLDGRAKE